MTFTENDLIFPSKKNYENIENINNTILSLLYTQAPYFDEVENSINTIKKVKIIETEPGSFISEFPAISQFCIEASVLENMNKTPIQKRFYNLAIKLWDLGVRPNKK